MTLGDADTLCAVGNNVNGPCLKHKISTSQTSGMPRNDQATDVAIETSGVFAPNANTVNTRKGCDIAVDHAPGSEGCRCVAAALFPDRPLASAGRHSNNDERNRAPIGVEPQPHPRPASIRDCFTGAGAWNCSPLHGNDLLGRSRSNDVSHNNCSHADDVNRDRFQSISWYPRQSPQARETVASGGVALESASDVSLDNKHAEPLFYSEHGRRPHVLQRPPCHPNNDAIASRGTIWKPVSLNSPTESDGPHFSDQYGSGPLITISQAIAQLQVTAIQLGYVISNVNLEALGKPHVVRETPENGGTTHVAGKKRLHCQSEDEERVAKKKRSCPPDEL